MRQMRTLPIDVRLNTEVTEATLDSYTPEAVILATGARPLIPDVPGIDADNVTTMSAVLSGEVTPGKRVLIVSGFDGYRGPPSLAEHLADQGHDVEFITERMIVGESMDPATNHNLLKRLYNKGVAMYTVTGLAAVCGRDAEVFNALTRVKRMMTGFDTIIIAVGGQPEDALHRALKGVRPDVYTVGDCLAPRRVVHAVLEGSRAARSV
jgi:pyruvate/2-oxoglutarate dehydrogenase complex dihydrolipoamide dehydrogenase (E3) component